MDVRGLKKINCYPHGSPSKTTSICLSSAPYLLVARHVYMDFPSSYTRMLAVFVVFTSVVEFIITAIYIGGVPVAEHDSLYP